MIGNHAEVLELISDPLDRLRALRLYREWLSGLDNQLGDLARSTITEARSAEPRPTWAQLGELLGVSGQRAEQLSRTNQPERPAT